MVISRLTVLISRLTGLSGVDLLTSDEGTDGNDVLVGSIVDDEINGAAGDDILEGRLGEDTLNGGAE